MAWLHVMFVLLLPSVDGLSVDGGPGLRVVRCLPQISRREADRAVSDGRVTVNGVRAKPSQHVFGGDVVAIDGKRVAWQKFAASTGGDAAAVDALLQYHVFHKPVGVTCSTDKFDRSSLRHVAALEPLMGASKPRSSPILFPVGRLDRDSSGLVLLTNDGRVAEALLEPRHQVEKEYVVTTEPPLDDSALATLAAGVTISTVQQCPGSDAAVTTAMTLPCVAERRVPTDGVAGVCDDATVRFVLTEGRSRQIRKMVEAVGARVLTLRRVRLGGLKLGEQLLPGAVREARRRERKGLLAAAARVGGAKAAGVRPSFAGKRGGGNRRRSAQRQQPWPVGEIPK